MKEKPVAENCLLCDLHIHTTYSDGAFSPRQIVSLAQEKGLYAIGLTDHDTVEGLGNLDGTKVEVVPGIEINSTWRGRELHILGYYIDVHDAHFLEVLERQRLSRVTRIERIVHRLGSMGYPLSLEKVMRLSGEGSPGRPHVALEMVSKGYVGSINEAFTKFLAIGKPAYVEREYLQPKEAIALIEKARGVPVWAHPGTAQCIYLLPELVESGLKGLEVYHPQHDAGLRRTLKDLARQNSLIITGGSDFHGLKDGEGAEIGDVTVLYETVLRLKELAG